MFITTKSSTLLIVNQKSKMSTTITITTRSNQQLSLDWTNTENLKKWISHQRTRSKWLIDASDVIFFAEYQSWLQNYWSITENMLSNTLNNDANIIDIGSGIAIIDLFLSLKLTQSKFTLIDRDAYSPVKGQLFGPTHPFYNSWDPVLDAIESNQLDPKRFNMISPDNPWPCNVDLISSHFSWCWHYDVHTYLEQVYHSLKDQGALLITFRLTNNENIVDLLNDKFGVTQDILFFQKEHQIKTESQLFDVPGQYYGGLGIWKKLK